MSESETRLFRHLIDSQRRCDTPAELQPTSDICVKQLLIASWFVLNSLRNKSSVVYWSVYEINLRLFTGNLLTFTDLDRKSFIASYFTDRRER